MFLISRGEINGRIDPDMILYRRKILKFNFPVKQLKHLLKDKPQYGSNQAGIDRSSEKEARYIRITDIDEYGLLKNNLGATAEFVEEKYLLNNNDILFARSGATVGKAYLHKSKSVNHECFFAGYMIRFLVNENLLSPDFLFSYTQLDVYKEWTKAIQRAAGQPNINAEEYKSLNIPLPPLEIQAEIISIFETAYHSKKQKETQAAQLLASIDGYLLEALGITLPPTSEKKTFFITNSSKISGGRFDPLFHEIDIFAIFKAGNFELVAIKELAHYLKTGFAAGKQDQDLDDKGVIQIRPTNVKEPDRDLTFNKNVYIKISEVENRPADLLQKGEILFNNTNSQELVGKTTLFDLGGDYFCSNHMTRIGTTEKINHAYLTAVLNLYQHLRVFYRMCVNWNNQSGVNTEMLRNIKIPLPPLEKQTEIADHISALRLQAKQLQHEAQTELERAKVEVERLILGEK